MIRVVELSFLTQLISDCCGRILPSSYVTGSRSVIPPIGDPRSLLTLPSCCAIGPRLLLMPGQFPPGDSGCHTGQAAAIKRLCPGTGGPPNCHAAARLHCCHAGKMEPTVANAPVGNLTGCALSNCYPVGGRSLQKAWSAGRRGKRQETVVNSGTEPDEENGEEGEDDDDEEEEDGAENGDEADASGSALDDHANQVNRCAFCPACIGLAAMAGGAPAGRLSSLSSGVAVDSSLDGGTAEDAAEELAAVWAAAASVPGARGCSSAKAPGGVAVATVIGPSHRQPQKQLQTACKRTRRRDRRGKQWSQDKQEFVTVRHGEEEDGDDEDEGDAEEDEVDGEEDEEEEDEEYGDEDEDTVVDTEGIQANLVHLHGDTAALRHRPVVRTRSVGPDLESFLIECIRPGNADMALNTANQRWSPHDAKGNFRRSSG
ncbi:unnamed protein product [Protopolystoma xenopodis]|uniref:Uncharacterized protein n=1 Tax=Protopolystoma xenopodis TaxID=117903 RepID=A0A448WDR1_9PLAT|nr:unnamed protein product [Protopolystoma xenopodis]